GKGMSGVTSMSTESNRTRRSRQLKLGGVARAALCTLSVLGTLAAASNASASGFSVARFGGEHGNPTTTNGTSLYYNPAGFAASDGTHVLIDVTAAWRSASYKHTVAPSDSSEAGGTDAELARE